MQGLSGCRDSPASTTQLDDAGEAPLRTSRVQDEPAALRRSNQPAAANQLDEAGKCLFAAHSDYAMGAHFAGSQRFVRAAEAFSGHGARRLARDGLQQQAGCPAVDASGSSDEREVRMAAPQCGVARGGRILPPRDPPTRIRATAWQAAYVMRDSLAMVRRIRVRSARTIPGDEAAAVEPPQRLELVSGHILDGIDNQPRHAGGGSVCKAAVFVQRSSAPTAKKATGFRLPADGSGSRVGGCPTFR